jgi:hypothetical protein
VSGRWELRGLQRPGEDGERSQAGAREASLGLGSERYERCGDRADACDDLMRGRELAAERSQLVTGARVLEPNQVQLVSYCLELCGVRAGDAPGRGRVRDDLIHDSLC